MGNALPIPDDRLQQVIDLLGCECQWSLPPLRVGARSSSRLLAPDGAQ